SPLDERRDRPSTWAAMTEKRKASSVPPPLPARSPRSGASSVPPPPGPSARSPRSGASSVPPRARDSFHDDLAQTAARPTGNYLAILPAGASVIAEKGFARATIEEIAGTAGVTPDIFYAHFQGKGALLRALNERFVEQMIGAIDSATRSGSWTNSYSADVV